MQTRNKSMANTQLFQSVKGKFLPATNTANEAGGVAYSLTPQHALVQLAAQVDASFVAKTAIYARERGHMKDMPAFGAEHWVGLIDELVL